MRCISIPASLPPLRLPCNKSFTKTVVPTPTATYQYNHEARRWDVVLCSQVDDPCPDMRRITGQLEVLHITSTPNHSTTLQNTSRSLKTTTSPTCLYSRSRVCNRFSTTAPHLSRRLRHHLTLDEVRLGCRQTHEMESVTLTGFSLREIWKSLLRSRVYL